MSKVFDRFNKYRKAEKRVKIGSIFLTRYEKSRIIGARALQISFQASPFIQVPPNVSDPMDIAELELMNDVLPITIRRSLPSGLTQHIPLEWLIKETY